ncbi:MAG TPA: xanthine dehydrogenase accessory protein XdhC [Acidisoma sp.]|uniref:xanthine dehydrogenase accessory protein XdhC n=1 Tax=Acidisoma sp. TaxID=1872115 RepID=UPI002CDD8EF6|nr:xanthine dehydrogenase accessory protein XdhC [Acidisoma sp.]HTI01429.1 xanthine dehydrogenase accessory protein XdhC [Acidisoma sp.]
MPAWLDALNALDRRGEAGVLVSVIAADGSSPREAGVKMVVSQAEVWDTIGGGNLEFQSIQGARALLASENAVPVMRDFPLGPALGQCCGGATTVLFEPIRPPAWIVALFGAGHVGRATAKLLGDLPCRLLWFDARPGIFGEAPLPSNIHLRSTTTAEDIAALPPGTMVLIMTHDHGLDYDLSSAALARRDLGFVGTIGSDTKRARFMSRLRRAGVDEATLTRFTCPVGLPGVGKKLPAEIAIAVVAQLLQLRPAAPSPGRTKHGPMTVRQPAEISSSNSGCGAPGCDPTCRGVSATQPPQVLAPPRK